MHALFIYLSLSFTLIEFIGGMPDRRLLHNVKDVFTVGDVVQNMYHNFSPAYRDYALQRSQNEGPDTGKLKTYFGGTVKPCFRCMIDIVMCLCIYLDLCLVINNISPTSASL